MFFNLWSRVSYFLADFFLYEIIIVFLFFFGLFAIYKVYKSSFSEKKQKLYLLAIFTFIILIFTFSAFEFYFRYVYDESDGLGFLKVNERWHKRHVVYNNYFFRDRDFNSIKRERVVRIGVFGDSVAFGEGIKNVNNRFSNILEQKLQNAGFKVEVYNLGSSGYDTEGEIEQYQRVKQLNFDIIIWQYLLNDIQPLEKSTGTPIISQNSQTSKLVKFLSNRSYFLDFIYWRFSTRYQKTFEQLKNADLAQYNNEPVFSQHQKQIADFVDSLKREKQKIIVVIFPFVHLLPDYPAKGTHTRMQEVFKESGVDAVIDLLADLETKQAQDLIASRFDPHPNEYVHQIAADRLFEIIVPLLK